MSTAFVLPVKKTIPCDEAFPKHGLDDAKHNSGGEHSYWIIWTDREHNDRYSNLACYHIVRRR